MLYIPIIVINQPQRYDFKLSCLKIESNRLYFNYCKVLFIHFNGIVVMFFSLSTSPSAYPNQP